MKFTIIILLGPPGSGKGTQAVRLSKQLHIPHISTGDLFREHIRTHTTLGKEADRYISQGKLVPDELTLAMLFERVAQPDCAHGYLLDGVPRTVHQAETLDKQLSPQAKVFIINLVVADAAIIRRLTGRLVCRECGHIHHREFSPPKVAGVCDRCEGDLYQRADDMPIVAEERLRVYRAQTEPVLTYYAAGKRLHTVNGEQAPERVFQELLQLTTLN